MSMKIYNDAIDNILSAKNRFQINDSIWNSFYDNNKKCGKKCGKKLKILVLNAPCNGFGDLIFALKLSKYLEKWYGAKVTIATTFDKGLLQLGSDPKKVVGLDYGKRPQCRKFKHLKLKKKMPKQDLILVAPITMDYKVDLNDVKNIFSYANELNTFYFSEYNDVLDKNFTFNTGIGQNRDGILLTDSKISEKKIKGLNNPYALVYVANSLPRVEKCIIGFIEMIAKKYYKKKKYTKIDIVIPSWFEKMNIDKLLIKKISPYYPNILIKTKNKTYVISENQKNKKTLTFRCDILPIPNDVMLRLMKYSINDILLTGDQSITDTLSCCANKNIFYQIAPWKEHLAKYLAKELPNKYISKITTSCGTLNAIKYKSNYNKFIKKWDFRKIGKPKLDAILLSIIAIKDESDFEEIANIILSYRSVTKIKNKVKTLYD